MDVMISLVLNNVYIILAFFGVFFACVIADIIAKTFYNVNSIGEKFSYKKLIAGLIRMLCIAVSSALLACVVGIVPTVVSMAGIAMTEEMVSLFTIATIAIVFLNGIVKYFKSAYETINKIINNEKIFPSTKEEGM